MPLKGIRLKGNKEYLTSVNWDTLKRSLLDMCMSYGNFLKSLVTFENLALKGHKTLLGFFVYCNLFCGLNPTQEACCIKVRGVWWENKYLGGIQAKPDGTSRDLSGFSVFPLYLWRGNPPCLLLQLKRWDRWRSAKVSLKHLPSYGTAWSSALTAVRMWGLGHHLRGNPASSRRWSSAPSALWVCPDVGHSLYRKLLLLFSC